MYQYYVVEIRKLANGEFEHDVTWHYDAERETARIKAAAKFHSIFSNEDEFTGLMHSAIMFSEEGTPEKFECYRHEVA